MTAQLTHPHRHPAPMTSVQGTLALDYGHDVRSSPSPDLRLVAGGRAELEAFAHRFACAVVEVVGGDRGPSQLLRWTSEKVYAELQRRSALLSGTTPGDRRLRRLRSQVRSVHLFCPSPEAAEVSVHVRQGERSRAIAARIELVEGRWCCTALQFG
ncbi:Rv3235 family protein [Marmoricola sp. URHB0036]|uniref:Rv3235 family protein n=1 Tax=Marmoricola sp. URHB0036 TaxID=1298863 RepID=UPI0004092857|nr:Rv3235 family protein [Marmoricola sp. URHB0036]